MGQIKNIKLHIVTDIKVTLLKRGVLLYSQGSNRTTHTYKMADISTSELACVYSALILYDDDIDITGEKMAKIISAAKVNVEAFWPGLFAKALQGRNIGDLICNVGSAPAAGGAAPAAAAGDAAPAAEEEKKEEKKEESESGSGSDDDMGFGLFD